MSSPNGLKSGTIRVQSSKRRGSALSLRSIKSATSNRSMPSNDACNQFYDKNLGKAYDKYK